MPPPTVERSAKRTLCRLNCRGGCGLLTGMRAVLIAIFLSLLCGRACAHFTQPCPRADDARPFTQTTGAAVALTSVVRGTLPPLVAGDPACGIWIV